MPPADAPGFCKEICRFQRPKSGAVNAKTKSILAFTIILISETGRQTGEYTVLDGRGLDVEALFQIWGDGVFEDGQCPYGQI
jgi:hypothetical protein